MLGKLSFGFTLVFWKGNIHCLNIVILWWHDRHEQYLIHGIMKKQLVVKWLVTLNGLMVKQILIIIKVHNCFSWSSKSSSEQESEWRWNQLPSGNLLHSYWTWSIEIVVLPNLKMVFFHSELLVYQMVWMYVGISLGWGFNGMLFLWGMGTSPLCPQKTGWNNALYTYM